LAMMGERERGVDEEEEVVMDDWRGVRLEE
jgi:hypothetical protein